MAEGGTFGYELDLNKLSVDEQEKVRGQIVWHKRIASLVQKGRYYRLSNPLTDPVCAWEHVALDGSRALVSCVETELRGYGIARYVVPRGLVPDTWYRDVATGCVYASNALMDAGLPLPLVMKGGEYRAHTFLLERCS